MTTNLIAAVEEELRAWPGVSAGPGRFNSTAFRYGRREIGHIHRNGVADLPFPRAIHDRLIAEQRAEPHQAGVPGYVSVRIRSAAAAAEVVELFRMNYDRAQASARARPKTQN